MTDSREYMCSILPERKTNGTAHVGQGITGADT